MPALASSPARARTVTFMPPESPTPGGASGEECTDRTPTRRTGCSNISTRAPWVASRPATSTRSTRGCLPAGAHMLPANDGPGGRGTTGVVPGELLVADLAGGGLDGI